MAGKNELIQSGLLDLDILSADEEAELIKCEQVIENGLGTFLDVGRALADIRDNRLYKATHKTFELYCKDRWDLGKAHAYRQIDGYEAVTLLEQKRSPIGDKMESEYSDSVNEIPQEMILPRNEAQVRPLTKLTPDQQVEAWALVLEWVNGGAKLTSFLVGKAAKRVKGASVKEVVANTKKEITEPSSLVSKLFLRQMEILTEIIEGEYNSGWRTTSKKEVALRLTKLLKAVDEMV
jgi:hypothetical protein